MNTSQRLSLVAIGDEVLCGHTVNTNAATISLACTKIGRTPHAHTVVGDDIKEMERVLRKELSLGGDVIAFGGLGPTLDDCTREVIAKIFETPLVLRKEYKEALERRYGKEFPTIMNQATQPEKAVLFKNTVGTAPGLFLEDKTLFPDARLFVLPGPPHELRDVFENGVLGRLTEGKKASSLWLSLIGTSEYDVECTLRRIKNMWPALQYGIYPSYEAVSVHFIHEDKDVLEKAKKALLEDFQDTLLPENMPSLEAYCVDLLQKRGWTLSAAESCTGGLFSGRMCSVNGASSVFLGGVVAYRDSVKRDVLAIPESVIERYGVVSEKVTEHMAESVRKLVGSDVAVATSGYFGPTGGTKEAPLGTVCVTILLPEKSVSRTFSFQGTRGAISAQTLGALFALLSTLLRTADDHS